MDPITCTTLETKLDYDLIFRNLSDAVLVWERQSEKNHFQIIDANAAACELYAYDHGDMLGLSDKQLNTAESLIKDAAMKTETYKKGHASAFLTHLSSEGCVITLEVESTLLNYNGRVLILSSGRDVGERIRKEKQYEERLVDALLNKRLEKILRHIETASRHTRDEKQGVQGFAFSDSLKKVKYAGKLIDLTPNEAILLRHLLHHAGHVVSYGELSRALWGKEKINAVKIIRVYIRHLREKIETNPCKPKVILTTPGTGYQIRCDSQ